VIVLDTNVISALMQRVPDSAVVAWLDGQIATSVWTTAVTVFEVQFGLDLLTPSRRRRRLESMFVQVLAEEFEGRVLSFDGDAAHSAGSIAARCRRLGRAVEIRDVQIAGIVAARRATLATRNTRHFDGLGIELANPWQ
jgi:predicted nucleic acid-binding protein